MPMIIDLKVKLQGSVGCRMGLRTLSKLIGFPRMSYTATSTFFPTVCEPIFYGSRSTPLFFQTS